MPLRKLTADDPDVRISRTPQPQEGSPEGVLIGATWEYWTGYDHWGGDYENTEAEAIENAVKDLNWKLKYNYELLRRLVPQEKQGPEDGNHYPQDGERPFK